MSRKEELLKYVEPDMYPLIDEVVFLENQLVELKKLPFIRVNPKDNSLQKSTPAAKQYKELLQQYTNIIKILTKSSDSDSGEESPLRKWMDEHINKT